MNLEHSTQRTDVSNVVSVRGRSIKHSTEEFSYNVYIDFFNRRVKVVDYQAENYSLFAEYLHDIAAQYQLPKIILIAREDDWQLLFQHGFLLEALHPSFFQGQPGFHLSKFLTNERRNSLSWEREEAVLNKVAQYSGDVKSLPPDYEIRSAVIEDVPALVDLYRSVFITYPTPMDDPAYVKKALQTNYHFKIVVHRGIIVSAASLDIDTSTSSAELTDCATLPDYRGQHLMLHLVAHLEDTARQMGLITVYTIARAASVGINAVFKRHGYGYYGRFINNCEICGQFENMNLWSKQLDT